MIVIDKLSLQVVEFLLIHSGLYYYLINMIDSSVMSDGDIHRIIRRQGMVIDSDWTESG